MSAEPPLEDDRRDAILSDDGVYRYQLSRTWDVTLPALGWIMLNPSTADAVEDDQTIRRCVGYAKAWGFGGIVVGNLFAYRTKEPAELSEQDDPVGPENDEHVRRVCDQAGMVVAAWGADGDLLDRDAEVLELIDVELYAIGTTQDGHPWHPLYKPTDAEPEPYPGRDSA